MSTNIYARQVNTSERDQYNYYGDSLDQTLRKLQPSSMCPNTSTDSTRCLEGTRTQVLEDLINWTLDPLCGQRIFWLHGLAGSGKSTIANTLADRFAEEKCLGAFLFFSRDVEERRQPSSVIRTIAYQLGSFDSRIGKAIVETITNNINIAGMRLLHQFSELIVDPLLILQHIPKPIVIVLDALDECGNAHSHSREDLLSILGTTSIKLPPMIRIIITSRKELDITNAFVDKTHILERELDLTTADITIFLRTCMSDIRDDNSTLKLAPNWPTEDKIHALAERAAGLFVWASIACNFIKQSHDPPKRLDMLLQGDIDACALPALDRLYATAFKAAYNENDDDFRLDFLAIMGTIIVARNPISNEAIDDLLGLKRPSYHTICKLGCVLSTGGLGDPVRIIHPSFADYLSDRLRCISDALYIDKQLHDSRLSNHCIDYLCKILKRNFCDLTLSMPPGTITLPEATSYASIFWITHVITITSVADSFANVLEQFLFEHFLHWLEVMSILKKSREVIALMQSLLEWANIHVKNRLDLCNFIYDGHRFVHLFTHLIEQHPLLIYKSALPFTPTCTTLYMKFFRRNDGIPRIAGGVERSWSPRLMVIEDLDEPQAVHSVTITPNGAHIISGLGDGVGIWDASSGAKASPRLRGHLGPIRSVACSPDGTWIASGSDDFTIRLWDIRSGTEVSVLRGHESSVTSVCFAPACSASKTQILLSGSRDCTIRLWDEVSLPNSCVTTRQCNGEINAVAFSPDGERYVAGAMDGTVRVWNTASGTEIFCLLNIQPASVRSVAFSPDGQWIASGSTDKIIRIWDAKLGIPAFQPLKGHEQTKPIQSLAFLPNEKRIVSGANNGTIRIWDFERGTEACPPLREHKRQVEAVIVSNNGRIISASEDKSIRIWTPDYSAKAREVDGPVNAVTALTFSYDGVYFATGLKDHSIHLWNTITGAKILRSLIGHTGKILSLSFSPDGRKIVSGADTKDAGMRFWEITTGEQKRILRQSKMGGTLSIAFSIDGRRIASGATDKIIRIWNLSSTKVALSLRGHEDKVTCIAFSPDGTQIISGSKDHTVRVWDAMSGAQITSPFTEYGSDFILSVAFSSDGLQIFSKSSSYMVVHTWSPANALGALSSREKTIYCRPRMGRVTDSFALNDDGWIIDTSSKERLSKLPPNIPASSVTASAASNTSLVFATDRGTVIVMHLR